jgi:ketosteroid isomerase-like protein
MKIKTVAGAAMAAMLLLVSANAALAGDDPKVAAEVMALARAQWAAEVAGKSVAEQSVATAEDYTEFNPDFPMRLEGKALANRLTEAQSSDGSKSLAADMVNPKVQVYGDTAVLTYNFVGIVRDKDGKTSPSAAKSTRVYARTGGKWMLVHANFAPAATKY